MKKGYIIIILVGLFLFPVFSQHPPQDKNWEVVFEDDFNTFNTGLQVYNFCGDLVKSVDITGRGTIDITIQATELSTTGTYTYFLLCDDQLSEAIEMILMK